MPLGRQPRRRRGTVGHPYTALNLRLALAIFGLVSSAVLAWLSWRVGLRPLAIALIVLGLVAVVDLVVIQLRRHAPTDGGSAPPAGR
jgi:hypothetical protein